MRHRLIVVALGSLAFVLAITLVASAAVPRVYEGRTEQGKRMTIALSKRDDGSLRLKEVEFSTLRVTCEDGGVQLWGTGTFFGGGGEPLDGRTLSYDGSDQSRIFRLSGRFRAAQAAGTVEFAVPAFTDDGQLQACTTGVIEWTAERTAPRHTTSLRDLSSSADVLQHRVGRGTITSVKLR